MDSATYIGIDADVILTVSLKLHSWPMALDTKG